MNTIGAYKYSITPKARFGLLTFIGQLFAGDEVIAVTEAWSAEGCLNQLMFAVRRAKQ